MKKYFSFFRIQFCFGLQYRPAFLSAIITQIPWGLMECLAYHTLHASNTESFPMEFSALTSYIWLKEAFLLLFSTWMTDNEIFDLILNGDVSYELCRPVSIYDMWFARSIGGRMFSASLRCVPILLIALLLPRPYNLSLPQNAEAFWLFVLTLLLGVFVAVAFCMLVYILSFFTLSPQGLRMLMTGAVEFLSGATLPLPFIPYPVRKILELLPFASMQNVPFRVYSGDLSGTDCMYAIFLQLFWLAVLVFLGKLLCRCAERRIVVQGG